MTERKSRATPERRPDLQVEVMSVLRASTTGIESAIVWVAAGEFDEADRHVGPRALVVLGHSIRSDSLTNAVSVLLTDPPEVLGDLPRDVAEQAAAFVVRNRDALLRHWRGEIDAAEMLDLVERV